MKIWPLYSLYMILEGGQAPSNSAVHLVIDGESNVSVISEVFQNKMAITYGNF